MICKVSHCCTVHTKLLSEWWLRANLRFCRKADLSGLNSLQGRDSAILELLKHMEGVGLLDAYLVIVDHYEYASRSRSAYNYGLANVDSETAIGHWMRLDGSNPGFADINKTMTDENVMQVSICIVCLIVSFIVHQYRLTSQT